MTTSSRVFRVVSVLSVAGLIVSCGFLKKKGDEADASAEAAVAEVVEAGPAPVAAPVAANVDDVARFPDEKALDNVVGTLQRVTNVREIPNIGKIVGTLQKGGTVTQIASRTTFFLVVFENPKDQKKLMGWVPQEAFTAAPTVDASVKLLVCTAPEIPLISDAPFCGRACTGDGDCPAGQACKGAANKFTNNKLGDAVTVCTVFTPPAAGVRPNRFTVVDAAVPVVPPPPPPAVKCPVGQIFVAQDKQCHQSPCKVGGCPAAQPLCIQCGPSLICVPVGERGLCK